MTLKETMSDAVWHCEPPVWSFGEGSLKLTTGEKTDFWQNTYYGFRRDDGHFLAKPVSGDFTAQITFEAAYEVLYDQAGLMLRGDAQNWLKAGIEFSDDLTNFSVVVTREGRSDWSVIAVPKVSGPQTLRLTRIENSVIVHYRSVDGHWRLMRLADLALPTSAQFGPMACSPERSGLKVRFDELSIRPPIDSPLHAH